MHGRSALARRFIRSTMLLYRASRRGMTDRKPATPVASVNSIGQRNLAVGGPFPGKHLKRAAPLWASPAPGNTT